jgi:hypothetical protein
VGIAFQAPENYKATIAKGSDGVNNSFCLPAVFLLNVLKLNLNTSHQISKIEFQMIC